MGGICQQYIKSTIRMKKLSLSSNCITVNIDIWMQHAMHNNFAFYTQNYMNLDLSGAGAVTTNPFVILSNP